jgi:hypothetical protein
MVQINELLVTMKKLLVILTLLLFSLNTRIALGELPGFLKLPTNRQLISDTLYVKVNDSLIKTGSNIKVMDNRVNPGSTLHIGQVNVLRYIPIDRYYLLEKPLESMLSKVLSLPESSGGNNYSLIVDNLTIWHDSKPLFINKWILNGYSRLENSDHQTVEEWQWEVKIKGSKKKKVELKIGQLFDEWIKIQNDTLKSANLKNIIQPHPYKRQLMMTTAFIKYGDGYAINSRMPLYFPADQQKSYFRSAPGILYQKSSEHEAIAVGGWDISRYYRLNQSFVARTNGTFRLGFCRFNTDKFDYINWKNMFLINTTINASIEYFPPFYRGLYAGIGINQSFNFLPDVVQQYNIGLLLTIGVVIK